MSSRNPLFIGYSIGTQELDERATQVGGVSIPYSSGLLLLLEGDLPDLVYRGKFQSPIHRDFFCYRAPLLSSTSYL